ncbi:hypothetical protein HAX54_019719 [Datura stramonium]|uniref:Uncharacterized protein n=1 Tax=Datura stramonium TaxID=4076 RepID=A0ABS8UPR0_DATST|nr:hypothetical protein [Datura stramonium]
MSTLRRAPQDELEDENRIEECKTNMAVGTNPEMTTTLISTIKLIRKELNLNSPYPTNSRPSSSRGPLGGLSLQLTDRPRFDEQNNKDRGRKGLHVKLHPNIGDQISGVTFMGLMDT